VSDEVGIADRIRDGVLSLPKAALAAGAVAAMALLVAASVYAWRTYDYIQHDNDFCLSCHLMVDPFERFARSAHREMGCKACHQPTIVTRSQMALTQIIENPDSLRAHAEVPNERCAECHINGDPEEWTLVAQAAGHRVHLESDDPKLQGLQCVQCHTTELHVFAARDKTCGQTDCHTDVSVRLGRMAGLEIRCPACHAFGAPVPDTATVETALAALRPGQDQCLSCHAMRQRVELPAEDPHGGKCSSCHNAHTQTEPAQAVESCATAGCHARPDTVSAFHRGLAPGILEKCTACHGAHDFRAPGTQCTDCHKDIDAGVNSPRSRSGGMRIGTAVPAGAPVPVEHRYARGGPSPFLHLARSGAAHRPVSSAAPRQGTGSRAAARGGTSGAAASQPQGARAAPQEPASARFRHVRHRTVPCQECHSSEDEHGALKVTTPRDCQACHHSPRFAGGPQGCARCHDAAEIGAKSITRTQDFQFASGTRATRTLTFDHAAHESRACTDCHTQPVTFAVRNLSCTQCHTEHHEAGNRCTACHAPPPANAHDVRSHMSCAGASCHREAPVPTTWSRELCLSCHQDRARHKTGRDCVACHLLPALKPARGSPAEDLDR
jgi:nitrate/TMAO reductase-like tetraheme cytochrome c subunit